MSFVSPPQQPDPHGSFSPENAPEVVVRADKYYVCSSCGTLVEIPAEVAGQLVIAVNPKPSAGASPTKPRLPGPPASSVSPQHAAGATPPASPTTQAKPKPHADRSPTARQSTPRPGRPKQLKSVSFVGQTIDGLVVPSGQQLDRALKWVAFHLRVLDRQGEELQRIKQQLKKRQPQKQCAPATPTPQTPTHTNVHTAPQSDTKRERGPP
ncbi:hypothetical protein [Bremerella sp.]|uniref:hypothetical protein n=1 Tax=Bremerella sp. TaxID=2795602 RepID=UPI003918C880